MSSLIFHTEPEQALIATDTLAVNPDGTPRVYTTKALILPHVRTVIAVTGIGDLGTRWFARANGLLVRGLEHLNYHTPRGLNQLYEELAAEPDFPDLRDGITTTIYQIGVSEVADEIRSFAYRSTNGFQSEPIGYGLRYKPECIEPDDCVLPAALIPMMESQRQIQNDLPPNQRVYIGGAIQVIQILKDAFVCFQLHRFDDADAVEQAMYDNFQSVKPSTVDDS